MKFTGKRRKAVAFAAKYAKHGVSYADIAKGIGVNPSTLFRWRQDSPEFAEALEVTRNGNLKPEQKPVSITEFIGPDYLNIADRVYPVVLNELREINSGRYDLILLVGGLGSGKTFAATISLLYELYKLLLLPDPHGHYGLDKNSSIILAVQNRSRKLAELNDFQLARNLIEGSPWFEVHAPHVERLKSRIKFVGKNIELWPVGADSTTLLGMNLHSLILDEGNFYQHVQRSRRAVDGQVYNQARESFESAIRRKQSRFADGSGLFLISSSKRFKGQFTDEIAAEFADYSGLYTYQHTEWSAKPEAYKDSKWFHIHIGDRTRAARILDDDEEISPADRDLIVEVPERYRRRFQSDVTRSLQDLAGISTQPVGAFFTDAPAVHAAAWLPNRFCGSADVTGDATLALPVAHTFDVTSPQSGRAVHVDLSLSHDATAVAIGHVWSFNERGLPQIFIDGLARIHAPKNGEIELDSVYRLIAMWKAGGIPLKWCSFDNFQSNDLIQRVAKLGIHTGRLSVDMTSPNLPMQAYEGLRLAVAEKRIGFPDDPVLVGELLGLMVDHKRGRVDHRPGGAKDCADAVCGVCHTLTNLQPWAVGEVPGKEYAAMLGSELGGTVTSIPGPNLSHMDMVRAYRRIGSSR